MESSEKRRFGKKYVVKKAASGLGLFAVEAIEKGEFIIEYVGEVISGKEAENRGGRYLFEINSRWTIDGTDRKNTARYINHSCRPNCEVRIEKKRVNIYAIKKIIAGQELAYDYGKEYFNHFIKPLGCRCAACKKKVKGE